MNSVKNMVRNITVGISDELVARMDTLNEVNWSAVTRNCIENYIKLRSAEGLESAISTVRSMRDKDFANGYSYVVKNSEKFTLGGLQEFYDGKWNLKKFENREITDQEDAEKEFDYSRLEKIFLSTNPDLEALGCFIKRTEEDEITGEISTGLITISRDFIRGMMEAANELFQKSN